ncbi:hypothetical protein N9V90_01245, partial [Endozoicomonas sp.]|nr:hypothetical protein [Endozoicomonas sp.]
RKNQNSQAHFILETMASFRLISYWRRLLLAGKGKTVFYCGSGVTACHNLLAMEYAGLGAGVLYRGSWSEWVVVPKRPLETCEL